MEQPNFASYVPSSYPNMMDLPVSDHQPFRCASNGPTTPGARQQCFDDSSYFNTVPPETLNIPISRVAESSLDPWLMDMPALASSESSRLSMSPSQSVATPPSDGFYSPTYPEQLQLPAYQLLEQLQPLRTCTTSHPNWVNSAGNWQHEFTEGDIWSAQPYVPQPWTPNSYDGYAAPNLTAQTNHGPFQTLTYSTQDYCPTLETVHVAATRTSGSSKVDDSAADDDSSEEDSDSDEESSDYSQAEGSTSGSRSKTKTRSPSMRVDRWTVPVNSIQQLEIRGHLCHVPQCTASFVRPEHLRRHVRSKHSEERKYPCRVPDCDTRFSRGDNLREHYWTHLHRGGRAGKNRKMTLPELKLILGPKEKKLIRRIREKQKQHLEKEKVKKQQVARPTYAVRSML